VARRPVPPQVSAFLPSVNLKELMFLGRGCLYTQSLLQSFPLCSVPMKFDRVVWQTGCLASALLITCLAYLQHASLRAEFDAQGWNRAIAIGTAPGVGKVKVTPAEANEVIASFKQPFMWGHVVSASALQSLRDLPVVESVHRQLRFWPLLDAQGRKVTVYVVSPEFVEAFSLGDPQALGTDLGIVAGTERAALSIAARYPSGSFELKYPARKSAPIAGAVVMPEIPMIQTLSKARFLPRPTESADNTSFYASPDWLDTPGRRASNTFPSLEVIVKVRAGANLADALNAVQQILDRAPSALIWPGDIARALPLIDRGGIDITRRGLLKAGRWIPTVLAVTLALIGFVFIWLRFRSLILELALRRSFGHSKWQSTLQTLMPEFIQLAVATAVACLLSWIWFAAQGEFWVTPKLLPAVLLGAALGISLALLFARALTRRSPALLLKSQLG
jgi:hypothetical protein